MEADDTKDVDESSSKLDFDGDDAVDLCCSVALAGTTGCGRCGATLSVASPPLANERLIVAPVVKQQLCRIQCGGGVRLQDRFCVAFPTKRNSSLDHWPALSALAFCHRCRTDRDTTCASLLHNNSFLVIALKTRSSFRSSTTPTNLVLSREVAWAYLAVSQSAAARRYVESRCLRSIAPLCGGRRGRLLVRR